MHRRAEQKRLINPATVKQIFRTQRTAAREERLREWKNQKETEYNQKDTHKYVTEQAVKRTKIKMTREHRHKTKPRHDNTDNHHNRH